MNSNVYKGMINKVLSIIKYGYKTHFQEIAVILEVTANSFVCLR